MNAPVQTNQKAQLLQQLQSAPDSVIVGQFLKPVIRTELLVREADRRKIEPDTALMTNVHRTFFNMIKGSWNGLGVSPSMLDSAGKATADEKAKLAGDRVETFLDRLIKQEMNFVEVPPPLEAALRPLFAWSGAVAHWFHIGGACLVFAPLIIVFAGARGVIGQNLSLPPLVWLGEVSFCLYMVHHIVMKWFFIKQLEGVIQALPMLPVLAACLAMAGLLHYLIERPCQHRLVRWIKGAPVRTA